MCLSVWEFHLVISLTRTSVHPPPVPRLQSISSLAFRRHFDNFDSYLPWKVTLLESFGGTLSLSQNRCHIWTSSCHIQITRSLLCVTYHPFVSLGCVGMSSPLSVCSKCVRMCFSVFVCLECFRRHSAGVARLWWESSRQRWLESWCGGGGRLTIQRQV